ARLNDSVYKPVDPRDPSIIALSEQIRRHGLLEPIVLTRDCVILSGHRRFAACKLAGLTDIPVRWHDVSSTDAGFPELLWPFDQERDKTPSERVNEEVVRTSPDAAFEALSARRQARLEQLVIGAKDAELQTIRAGASRRRSAISDGKREMLDAALRVL